MKIPVLVALLLLWFSANAQAQNPSVGATGGQDLCLQDVLCRQHSANARELSKAGKLVDAITEYEAAYREIQIPVFLYNLGRLNQRLGKLKQAKEYYQRYLDAGIEEDAGQRARAIEYLKQMSEPAKAVVLTAPAPDGSVANPPSTKPIYKRWWFWTITGAVIVGVAVGLGVGFGTTQNSPVPSGLMNYQPTF